MSGPNGETPQVEVIQPSPTPLTIQVDIASDGLTSMVLMRIFSPTGMATYFLPADFAKTVGALLAEHAQKAAMGSRLVVPQGIDAVLAAAATDPLNRKGRG